MLPKEIQKILDQQGLELVEILQRPDTKRRRFFNLRVRPSYAIPLRQGFGGQEASEGKLSDLVLKIFGRGDPNVVSGFEKEAEFLELVMEQGSGNLKTRIPQFVGRGDSQRPWCLREYVKGEFFGDICLDFGIKKEVLTPSLREEFLAFFGSLRAFSQKVSQTEFFSSLSTHGYDWYENDRNFYRERTKTVSRKDLDLIGGILKEKKDLLDREARFLVHGDLYLKNMFWDNDKRHSELRHPEFISGSVSESDRSDRKTLNQVQGDNTNYGKLAVIDWELLHRGNLAFDIGFIWALSWKDPAWREKLLSDFRDGLSREEHTVFDELLSVVKISLALRFIRHSEIMEEMVTGDALENAKGAKEAHYTVLREVIGNQ